MSGNFPAKPDRWSDLGTRVLSAAVLIPAVLADVWLGGVWFRLFVALIGVLMAYEWTRLAHGNSTVQFPLHVSAALCGALLPHEIGISGALAAIAIITAIASALAQAQPEGRNLWRLLGAPYVGFAAAALVQLRADPAYGFAAIIWILVVVWAADSLAYFSGKVIGGPKLAPAISPNKTWAGFGGAMAGAALASALFALVTGLGAVWILIVLAALLAVIEQGGDLFKSAFKRHYGVKDTGRLIPGHGGVIDRVDGLVAVAMASAVIGLLRDGANATGRGILVW